MKKLLIMLLFTGVVLSCAGTGGNMTGIEKNSESVIPGSGDQGGTDDFSDVIGVEWKLTEVSINGTATPFSRNTLSNNFSDSFTLTFNGEMLSGRGAPNLYSAPYTLGGNRSISTLIMRSTLMAAIFEPEHLKEHDFYIYMQYIHSWRLSGEILELSSLLDDSREVILIFEK